MVGSVREPIQVYLSSDERAALERAARDLGLSRSEVLRRGLRAVSDRGTTAPRAGSADNEAITPASAGPGPAPPSLPIAPLRELLEELSGDRGDR